MGNQRENQSARASQDGGGHKASTRSHRPGVAGAAVSVASVAVVVVLAAACVYWKQDTLPGLFGPPAVAMDESYAALPDGPVFDHSILDQLLTKHVSPDGWVDYEALARDADSLDVYIDALAKAQIEQMGRDQRLALLINAYNAFTLRLILDHYPLSSIKEIPSDKRWDDQRWRIGPLTLSLNQIEHEQIRPHFKEPRIHFALVCAAVGCPPLRNEAYTAQQLESQLDSQSRYVHSHDRWLRFEPNAPRQVYLTKLYDWYGGDFEQAAGSVLGFVAQYAPALQQALDRGQKPRISWLEYDWSLNSRPQVP